MNGLFPATQAPVRKTSGPRKEPETMSVYPTADSVKSKQPPRPPPNYPPSNPPKQVFRRNQPPPPAPTAKACPPSRKAPAPVEQEDDESVVEEHVEFRYAPRAPYESDVERQNQGQAAIRMRRRASQAPPVTAMQEDELSEAEEEEMVEDDHRGRRKVPSTHHQQGRETAPEVLDHNQQAQRAPEGLQGETQRGPPSRSRRPTIVGNDPFLQNDTMGDGRPADQHTSAPTRGRSRSVHPHGGEEFASVPTHALGQREEKRNTPASHHVNRNPHPDQSRMRGRSMIPGKQTYPEEHIEETDRDEPVEIPPSRPRGRSRAPAPPPTSQHHVVDQDARPNLHQHFRAPTSQPTRGRQRGVHDSANHDPQDQRSDRRGHPAPSQPNTRSDQPPHAAVPPKVVQEYHPVSRSRSTGPAASESVKDWMVNAFVTKVSEDNAALMATNAIYEERMTRMDQLEQVVDQYRRELDGAKDEYMQLEQRNASDREQFKAMIASYLTKAQKASQCHEALIEVHVTQNERLKLANADYIDRWIVVKAEHERLEKLLKESEEKLKAGKEAIAAAKEAGGLCDTAEQELLRAHTEIETLKAEATKLRDVNIKTAEEKLAIEEAAYADADACWKALEGKLSAEKIDSLRLNKASPVQELIKLSNDAHTKAVEDAKSLAAAQSEIKAVKTAYNAGCDQAGETCKALGVEPPARSTPNFLVTALKAATVSVEKDMTDLKEARRRIPGYLAAQTELCKKIKELQDALEIAEAERDDLKQQSCKTKEELSASAEKAKIVVTLQKELKEYQERDKSNKKTMTQNKEEIQSCKTQTMTYKGEAEAVKAKLAESEAQAKEIKEKNEEQQKKIQALIDEVAKGKETAKIEQAKMNGIGVSAAAARADEIASLRKELEAEKAKHDEAKLLERWSTGNCTPAEKALLRKAQSEATNSAEAEKLAEARWLEKLAKAENEAARNKKMAGKWEQKFKDLDATVAATAGDIDGTKGKAVKKGTSNQMSRTKSIAGPSMSGAKQDAASAGWSREDLVAAAMIDSDYEDDLQPTTSPKKQTASGPKSVKKPTESTRAEQDQIAIEYQKASQHPDVLQAQSKGKRAATEGPNEPGTSSPKKARFTNLPSSEQTVPGGDDMMDGDLSPLPTDYAGRGEEPEVESQVKTKSASSSTSALAGQKRSRGKSMAPDQEDGDETLVNSSTQVSRPQVVKKQTAPKRVNAVAPRRK